MRSQEELQGLVREILNDDYLTLAVTKYTLHEDLRDQRAEITCALTSEEGAPPLRSVEGTGVGMVDALFKGLKSALSDEYTSLNHIYFVDFRLAGDFSTSDRNGGQSDVPGRVHLEVENSSGRRFNFEHAGPSISASSVEVVLAAVEHFVNAELAVLRVYDWIDDAKRRSRPDLADKYTSLLAELVANSSYSETIERKKTTTGV